MTRGRPVPRAGTRAAGAKPNPPSNILGRQEWLVLGRVPLRPARNTHPETKPGELPFTVLADPADNFCALLGLAAASTYRCVAPVKETQRAEHSYGLFGL